MIQCYSNNVSLETGEAVVFNNTVLKKGCTVDVSGASIQFNKCGIYEVSVNATGSSSEAAAASPITVTLQLFKSGVAQPQGIASATLDDETDQCNLAFTTLVQVADNNSCCPCSSPTVCNIRNTEDGAVLNNVNIVITKIV